MPVKLEFEKPEDAPEGLRNALVEADGKYVFEGETVAEVRGLRTALQKEREAKAQFERDLARYKDVDPDRYAQMIAAADEAERDKMRKQGKLDELHQAEIKRLQAAHQAREDEVAREIAARDAVLDKLIVGSVITEKAIAAGARPDAMDLITRLGAETFKRDGDRAVVRDPSMLNPKTGKELSIEDWLGDLAASRPYLFGDTKGSGARTGTTGGTPGQNNKKLSEMSVDEKVAWIGQHGAAAWQTRLEQERLGAAAAGR